VSERIVAQRLIEQLHAARVAGDLPGMCRVFADQGRFEILGASADKSDAIRANDPGRISALALDDGQGFRITHYQLLSLTVEWPRAVAHWRADIYSKVTGVTIPTELVDVAQLNEDSIQTYTEFFAPR